MNKLVPALATLLLAIPVGCSDESKAADSAPMGLDLSKLSIDEMKAEGSKLVGEVTAKLEEIKDSETAERIAKQLEPMVDTLAKLKDKLAASLDLSALARKAEELKTRFMGDETVMEKLDPLLEKIRGLAD